MFFLMFCKDNLSLHDNIIVHVSINNLHPSGNATSITTWGSKIPDVGQWSLPVPALGTVLDYGMLLNLLRNIIIAVLFIDIITWCYQSLGISLLYSSQFSFVVNGMTFVIIHLFRIMPVCKDLSELYACCVV